MAKVLVVGGGGREHALAYFLSRSPQVERVYAAPGNAGTPNNVPLAAAGEESFPALLDFARREGIELTVVGPEAPLCAGIADAFRAQGLSVFGPGRDAARLEGDKAFARRFMERHGIPHPTFAVFDRLEQARRHVRRLPEGPVVVKASGLAGGKGALVCGNRAQALEALHSLMAERIFGAAGSEVVIEEFMEGEEASILALCDGRRALYLAPSQDHKRVLDGDRGPNTGGMGAYAPAPVVTPEVQRIVDERIVQPALRGLEAEGTPYRGCLYVGLMIRAGQPRVVEFNCRFGDPEIQAVLPLLEGDLYSLLACAAEGELSGMVLAQKPGAACCVVLAAGGYPGPHATGKPIEGLAEAAALPDVYVFHAGTRRQAAGQAVTAGGRVLGVTGTGASIREAIAAAYRGASMIRFEGCHYRRDIGYRALGQGRAGEEGT
jgi:phosphoribosylamine--glycine ligase